MHQDKRQDLENEIHQLNRQYEKAKKDEQLLIGHRDRLQAIQNERSHPSEWTLSERTFVYSMSREYRVYFSPK